MLAARTHASEATHPPFGADTWLCHRCCGLISGTLQEPRRDPRGTGHVRCRMPRPDATPRCVGRQELCSRVGELPSSPRLIRRQGGQGRSASRRHHAIREIQRFAIRPPPLGLRMRGLHDHSQPVRCRAECARPQAVSGVRRTQLRSNAAGLSSARHCAQAADQLGCAPRIPPTIRIYTFTYVDGDGHILIHLFLCVMRIFKHTHTRHA